jgi:hypothetical protein
MDEDQGFAGAEKAPFHEPAVGKRRHAVFGECVESVDVFAGFGVVHESFGKRMSQRSPAV